MKKKIILLFLILVSCSNSSHISTSQIINKSIKAHGWDQDVKKWFIELNICCHGTGNVVQWYNNEKEYLLCLRKYTH